MHDPDDLGVQQEMEMLRDGPSGPRPWETIRANWRPLAAALLGFVLGVAAAAGVAVWSQAGPEPSAFRPDEHAVELVLFQATPTPTDRSEVEVAASPMYVDSALLLSGLVTSTVLEIGTSGTGLDVRAPALPVTVSPTGRLHELALEVFVRDCKAASQWAPDDRPFTIAWRDAYGRVHTDRAGDFGASVAAALTRYIEAVCDRPSR